MGSKKKVVVKANLSSVKKDTANIRFGKGLPKILKNTANIILKK